MQSFSKHFLTLLAVGLFASGVSAQSITWEPAGGQLGYGKTNRLSLVFDGCQPDGSFALPSIDGLDFSQPARSEQTSIINFKVSSRIEYSYAVQPTRRGEVVIPPLNIMTDKGRLRVEEARFEIVEATVGQTNLNIDDIVTGLLQIPKGPFWEGQIIEVSYLLMGSSRFNVNISSLPEWTPSDMLVEPFGEPERVTATINNEERPGLRYRTRALVRKPGSLKLAAVQQRINIQTGDRSGFFMSRPQAEEFLITSNEPTIRVQELPSPAPEGFSGAVGVFDFESEVVPTETQVGDPVTWTVSLEGTGNWPEGIGLPKRQADVDFKVIQPQSRRSLEDGQLFTGSLTEDVVLVPTRAGRYSLGAVDFTFFNPETARYETKSGEAVTVTITPMEGTARTPPPPDSVSDGTTDADALDLPVQPPVLERTGPALPGDPLNGSFRGRVPFSIPAAWWALIVILPAVLTWVWQILRRIWADDPNREARRARRELAAVTNAIAESQDPVSRPALILDWMRLVARAMRLPTATPTAAIIDRHLSGADAERREWHVVWTEAENALYGHERTLPDDWAGRAGPLVSKIKMRRRAPSFLFRRRYWLPLLLLTLAAPPQRTEAAAAPIDQYREGAYAEAEALWQEQLSVDPRNAALRNNLALALAQQDRWSEANAWWTSAYVLDPTNEDIRWNLRTGLSRAAGMQPRLAELLEARGPDWLATRFAPGTWSLIQAGGAALAAFGLALTVFGLFRRIRATRLLAPITLVAGTLGLGLGTVSHYQYGVLATPEAVVVMNDSVLRSIPTDAADSQQSRSLPAGEIGRVSAEFLGWRRLTLDSGETGWVRHSVLVPVYRESVK